MALFQIAEAIHSYASAYLSYFFAMFVQALKPDIPIGIQGITADHDGMTYRSTKNFTVITEISDAGMILLQLIKVIPSEILLIILCIGLFSIFSKFWKCLMTILNTLYFFIVAMIFRAPRRVMRYHARIVQGRVLAEELSETARQLLDHVNAHNESVVPYQQ